MTLVIRYAARSDVGLLREGNEDSAYAGPRLLAVADGMGGHAHGEVASAVAINALAPLDDDVPGTDLIGALENAVREANDTLHRMVEEDASLEGMGTTLTAMLWSGGRVALCHLGDSRAYLLRDGDLYQITHDQTLVQSLVDEGRISEDEAATHPQRSLLLRALDGRSEVEPDLSMREAQVGDRYLLCSDGLSTVVTPDTLLRTLSSGADLDQVTRTLIDLANRGGGPDNITCVVADVLDSSTAGTVPDAPMVAGAAANATRRLGTAAQDTPAARARTVTRPTVDEDEDDEEDEYPAEGSDRRRRRWPWAIGVLVLLLIIGGVLYGGWRYNQTQYYVGADSNEVVIYRGMSQNIGGLSLSKVYQRTGIRLGDLPDYERQQVRETTQPGSLHQARQITNRLRHEANQCKKARTSTPPPPSKGGKPGKHASPTPTPSPSPTAPPGCPGAPA